MASDSEASCISDPNFAIICGFLEKFGELCAVKHPDFLDLQEMLENTQEGKFVFIMLQWHLHKPSNYKLNLN